jgi:hypothetical protein
MSQLFIIWKNVRNEWHPSFESSDYMRKIENHHLKKIEFYKLNKSKKIPKLPKKRKF